MTDELRAKAEEMRFVPLPFHVDPDTLLALLDERDRLRAEVSDAFDAIFHLVPEACDEQGKYLTVAEKIDRLAAEVDRLGQMESDAYDAIFYAVPEACGEDGKELSVPEKIGRLVEENARLRAAMTDLLPGYEQYLEWCVARGVMFVSEGRKILAEARSALEPK